MLMKTQECCNATVKVTNEWILKNHSKSTKTNQNVQNLKRIRLHLLIPFFVFLVVNSTTFAHEKYSNVKIYLPTNIAERNDLLGLLEIDHYQENKGVITATLDDQSLLKLKSFKCKYEIISKDAIADLELANKEYYASIAKGNSNSANRVAGEQNGQTVNNIIKTPAAFQVKTTLGGYYSFAEMNTAMDNLVAAYPTIAQKFSIGKTTEGRDMWCIKISDNVAVDDSDEPEVLFMGHHHAREAIGGASMIFLMQYLCENYATNQSIHDLIDNREIFIIVCVNPDGWEYNRTTNPNGGGQWRKNRRVNASNTFGVDLNRNWGIDWANCTGAQGSVSSCGSSSTSSDVYWGPSAFSEPETKNLKAFVQSRKFTVCMDQHSVGPYYSLPFGRTNRTLSPLDNQIYTQVTSIMGKYNGMRYGNTFQTLGYEVSGGMKDWLLIGDTLNIGKVYGMTGEGSNGTSTTSFWPKAAEIITLCKGMIYQDLQIAYTAGSYVDFQDIGKLNVTAMNGKFYFKVRRIGLQNKPVTVTLIPLANVATVGNAITINSLPNFNSTYIDSIPYTLASTIANGNTLRYAWKIETGGYTYYDTIINIFNPTVQFTDNMEGSTVATNWTVSAGWAYTNDAAYSGTKSLAESPASAKYANSKTLTATCKKSISMSTAISGYISFWVKHRCENFRDKLQLQVSSNGTTWTAISGVATIKEPGTADGSTINGQPSLTGIRENWTKEVFDISNFSGVSALKFRLVFTSDASSAYAFGVDNGFNIDDFIVITGSKSSPNVAANSTTNFTGQTKGTKNVLTLSLSDVNYNKFIIERTVNGVDFEELGVMEKGTNANEFTFTDEQPYSGDNLYRYIAVNNNPAAKQSNLVSLPIAKGVGKLPQGIQAIYPNPATNNLQINFNVTQEETYFNLNIFSVSGQVVYSEAIKLNTGQNTIAIDATTFAKGQYIISFTNPENRVSYESKFMKL